VSLIVKIPIQNIYFLLCYAWDKLAEKDVVAVEAIDSTSLAELFSRVLINGTHHLLKRGFDRGYVPRQEWTGRLRGRICFQEAVRRNATATGMLPCDFDELSYDVLHNRILKTTMRRLIRTEGLAPSCGEGLAQLCRLMSDIQDIELTNRVFGQVQLHRNNQFYDFLVKVCELIYRNLLVSEKSGASKFMDFFQDRQQMALLFENFVRNFYRVHTTFRVKREDIYWRWIAADPAAAEMLPKMQTDISLTSDTRKIIIDCKFTPEATQHHYEAETLRSSHLYQIHAYLNNLPEGRLTDTCELMLLYPTVDSPLTVTYTDKGRKISIRTINLNQPWQSIHQDLLELVA
jgi:5-methylcytosine-specific restriction enzyme subunit McrC